MKVFWKVPQQQLQIEAESGAELRVVSDLLLGGPMAKAQWLTVPEAELPFTRHPHDGITKLMGPSAVVIGLVWDVPAHAQPNELLKAEQALGQAFSKLLGLLHPQVQIDLSLPATGVAPV